MLFSAQINPKNQPPRSYGVPPDARSNAGVNLRENAQPSESPLGALNDSSSRRVRSNAPSAAGSSDGHNAGIPTFEAYRHASLRRSRFGCRRKRGTRQAPLFEARLMAYVDHIPEPVIRGDAIVVRPEPVRWQSFPRRARALPCFVRAAVADPSSWPGFRPCVLEPAVRPMLPAARNSRTSDLVSMVSVFASSRSGWSIRIEPFPVPPSCLSRASPRDLWVLRTAWSADARWTSGHWCPTVGRFDSASAYATSTLHAGPGRRRLWGASAPDVLEYERLM